MKMVTKLKHYNPSHDELVNDWQVLDASGQVLGRLATQVATFLMGKHKPDYTPFLKTGDAALVRFAPTKPMAIEQMDAFPELSRFAIRDMGKTVAAGVCMKVEKKA